MRNIIIVASLMTAVRSAPTSKQYFFDNIPASVDLVWYPCNQTFECARLSVPLDALDPNNGLRAEVPIVKYPAQTNSSFGDYKGIILTNPGGPGGAGTDFIFSDGESIQSFTGSNWDIIGFDPRGIGYSVPSGACGIEPGTYDPSKANATTLSSTKKLSRRDYNASNHWGLRIPNRADSWIEDTYTEGAQINAACKQTVGADNQAAPYMTTPNVATDMLSIAKANARLRGECEDDVLVNYYGVSYGTIVGQTFASLYPDHVGRFVMDGVVDAKGWYNISLASLPLTHTDEALSTFFTTCHNGGPQNCTFYTGHTSHDIRDRFNALAESFPAEQAETEKWANASVIEYALDALKATLTQAPYDAIDYFPVLSYQLVALEDLVKAKNVTKDNIDYVFRFDQALNEGVLENVFEVWCEDVTTPWNTTVPDFFIDLVREQSVSSGERLLAIFLICSQWSITPKWKYSGTIGGDTTTPILFVGNSLDPITPYENAEGATKLFKKAEMLYVDATAHTTLQIRNDCVTLKLQAYYQNLTLPGHDNRCAHGPYPFKVPSIYAALIEAD